MAKQKLQTYDISFYDLQAKYDKKMTDLEQDINRLQQEHTVASKKAHEAFLLNDASFKDKIERLKQENKKELAQYDTVLETETKKVKVSLKAVIDAYNEEVKANEADALDKQSGFNETIEAFKKDEADEIEVIRQKYQESIASYQEKLDIYNHNFNKNTASYEKEVAAFLETLTVYKNDVDQFENKIVQQLNEMVQENTTALDQTLIEIDQELADAQLVLTSRTNEQLDQSKQSITAIDVVIEDFKESYRQHFTLKHDRLQHYIDEQKTALNDTRYAIQTEFDEQMAAFTKQKEIEKAAGNTQQIKNIDKKIAVYQARAKTTKTYESLLHQNLIDFYESEHQYFKDQERVELENIDKLRIFLVSDQHEISHNIDYFKDVNETLLTHVKTIEKKRIEQLKRHEQVRQDYALNQCAVFQKLKENIITLTDTHLSEVVNYYQKIDALNQFIDTAEPLKEIRISALKKELEIKELNQRVAFKIGKESRDIGLINAQKEYNNALAKLKRDKEHAALKKEIDVLELINERDREMSNAFMKFQIAKEEYDMRVQNRVLERAVLDSQLELQKKTFELNKDMAKLKVHRQYDLREKELEYEIKIIQDEQNYQVEVLERDLEDQVLKLDEKLTKIRNQINAYKVQIDTEINQKKLDIKHQKDAVEVTYQNQIDQVDSALKREIREPKNRLFESKELIESRLDQYNTYNIQFVDFMEHLIETHKYSDDLDKCREKVLKDTTFKTYVQTYLTNVYKVLETALKFMHKVDMRRLDNQMSNAVDASSTKKLDRQKSKIIQKYDSRLKRLARDLEDRRVVIDALVEAEYMTFKKSSIGSIEQFDELLTIFYNKIFDRLRGIQKQLLEESVVMYHPLTKTDEDIIDYAKSSAKVAKEKVKQDLQAKLDPLDSELKAFILEKNKEQEDTLNPLEQEKELLEGNLEQIKTSIHKKIQDIETEGSKKLSEKKDELASLYQLAEQDVASALEDIDGQIEEMAANYENNVARLDQKDAEAKTILDYEEKILTMAKEAAEYRFKDATVKAENTYVAAVQRIDQKAIHIVEEKSEAESDIEQELKALYNRQDSFANKNDIKDQIQMVRQEINVDLSNKKLEKADLEQKIQDIITSSETVLFATLDEAKQAINENVERYFNACQENSSQAEDLNEEDHAVMMKHYQAVKDALYVMKETKHKNTLRQLEETNKHIFGEEA